MKAFPLCCLAIMLSLSQQAHAQAYKCKQANGRVSFQDQPCEGAGGGSAITLPSSGSPAPAPGKAPARMADSPKAHPAQKQSAEEQWRETQRQREEQKIREENDKITAYNKSVRCSNSRKQLEIVKMDRPVFTRDNDGNRHYLEDSNRAAAIAAAERRVAEDCR
ncbi:MAG: DUF4124 domain-containing protein [Rhodocyclaceae bacterium]